MLGSCLVAAGAVVTGRVYFLDRQLKRRLPPALVLPAGSIDWQLGGFRFQAIREVAFEMMRVVDRMVPRRWITTHRNAADVALAVRIRRLAMVGAGFVVTGLLLLAYIVQ